MGSRRKLVLSIRKGFLWSAVLGSLSLFLAQAQAGELRRTAGGKVPGQYIVVFKGSTPSAAAAADLARAQGGRVEETWKDAINGALISGLSEKAAEALAKDPRVAWVQEDALGSVEGSQASPPWGLDRIDQRFLPLNGTYNSDFDGTGIHAYIFDTGIRDTHLDFGGRASRDFDSVGDGQNGNDCHGHGTHVAGTLGGATYGVAKNVRLHAVRVCNCSGQCLSSAVVSGVNQVVATGARPAVANMSLGFVGGDAAIDAAVNNAISSGIFFAVSAGNNNADACGQSPARVGAAVTVGATTSTDARASFSNFGSCLDLFAPGEAVLSAWRTSNTATATLNGTSMASPHVAGAAALLLDESPALTAGQVAAELVNRSTLGVVTDPGLGSPNRLLYTLGSPPPAIPPTPASLTIYRGFCFGLNDALWTASAGATSYQLYGSTSSSFTTQTLYYSGPNLDAVFNVPGTRYMRVRACNASGCSGYRNGNGTATYTNGCL